MSDMKKDQYDVLVELARKDPVVLLTLRSLRKLKDPIPTLVECIRVLSITCAYYQSQLVDIISTDTRKLEISVKDWSNHELDRK